MRTTNNDHFSHELRDGLMATSMGLGLARLLNDVGKPDEAKEMLFLFGVEEEPEALTVKPLAGLSQDRRFGVSFDFTKLRGLKEELVRRRKADNESLPDPCHAR